MGYRPDIDGMRALAVGLVLLFHLDFSFMQGGFIGVDVFFVISGYLITRNILNEGTSFRLGTFFARRIRRLMPAVWATVALTILLSLVLMSPDAARDAGRSAIAAVFSFSNISFWLETGYWDTHAALKHLLHTWSLGVEEQFYLLWPLLLLALRPIMRRWWLTAFFVLLAIGGTALSQWTVERYPSAAFYLMPFRVMEFAIGATIASGETHFRWRAPRLLNESLTIVGIAAIVWAGVAFDEVSQVPGVMALIPCFGAALIIIAGSQALSSVLLDNAVSVYVGRISYSLYLAHWPIVSLYKYVTLDALDWREQVMLGGATIIAGILLHHLVEKPFRYGQKSHPAHAFGLAAAFTVAICLVTLRPASAIPEMVSVPMPVAAAEAAEAVSNGEEPELVESSATPPAPAPLTVDWRAALALSRDQALAERYVQFRACSDRCDEIIQGRFNIIVIGDSHGPDGYNIMHAAFPDAHIIPAWRASCLPFVGVAAYYETTTAWTQDTRRDCLALVERIYSNRERLAQADLIVFSTLSLAPSPGLLDETLVNLAGVDTPVLVLGNAPSFTQHLPEVVRARALTPDMPIPNEFIEDRTWTLDSRLQEVTGRHGASFVSKVAYFCPEQSCSAWTADRSRLITYDGHHLSLAAADAFGRSRAGAIRSAVR